MLIVTYPKDDTFLARAPFALQIEDKLLHMDRLLDDSKLILKVSNDLMHSAPQAAWNGRPATPVVVTLRCAVVRALMGWSYATAHAEIAGSVKWRWFCRIYDYAVPNHSTLQAREALIRPSTLQHLHRRVVQLAQAEGVTQGKQLRADGTVIETNLHYPTDSHLLSDSVRVLGRLLDQARRVLKPQTAIEKKVSQSQAARTLLGAQNRLCDASPKRTKTNGKSGAASLSAVSPGDRANPRASGTNLVGIATAERTRGATIARDLATLSAARAPSDCPNDTAGV